LGEKETPLSFAKKLLRVRSRSKI